MSDNLLVVNAEGPETRIGLVEKGRLAEIFIERKRERGTVGNIYKGKVMRVLPGMQAAFVDLGPTVEKSAFLYAGDIMGGGGDAVRKLFGEDSSDDDDEDDDDEGNDGDAPKQAHPRQGRRSNRPERRRKIEELVKERQEILVQIVKDPIGPKGARVTTYLSLAGRHLVLMPTVDSIGISRRISSDKERKRLRGIVESARAKGIGFIVRTAAEGAPEDEIRDDIDFLIKQWREIGKREQGTKAPVMIYSDLDLTLRSVRDHLTEDIAEMVVDSESEHERVRKFVGAFMPRYLERIKRYDGKAPIFDRYGLEPQLRLALERRVSLKSGGSLIVDQHEALTAIDVNTGRFVGKHDLEETITKNNLEACQEVANLLRLRNIGGIIVVDFVDMDKEANRRKVWDAFSQALGNDRHKSNLTKISELGLVEMTRKRTRESLVQVAMEPCAACSGRGLTRTPTTVACDVLREVRRVGDAAKADVVVVQCAPVVAERLGRERAAIDEIEKRLQKRVDIQVDSSLRHDQYRVDGKLGAAPAAAAAAAGEPGGGGGRRGGRGKRAGKKSSRGAARRPSDR